MTENYKNENVSTERKGATVVTCLWSLLLQPHGLVTGNVWVCLKTKFNSSQRNRICVLVSWTYILFGIKFAVDIAVCSNCNCIRYERILCYNNSVKTT